MDQRRPVRAVCMLVATVVGLTSWVPVSAQVDERLVKASALVNVGLFVDWPAVLTEKFVIAVAADEEFAGLVGKVAHGRRVQNRDMSIRRVTSANEACECQLLFVSGGEDARAAALLRMNRGRSVLTIGETSSFLREGGIVRIFRDDDRLRLQINSRNAEDAGLRISSRLLRLAVRTP